MENIKKYITNKLLFYKNYKGHNEKNIQIEIRELKLFIVKLNYNYYVKNTSLISDYEYDKLIFILNLWEKKYPKFKTSDSPSLKVGSSLEKNDRGKYKHIIPMLSIQNAFSKKEIIDFQKRIEKSISGEYNILLEPKVDGISIALIYKNGILDKAVTRGNGVLGEIVTSNLFYSSKIPKKINYKGDIEIRGEIYIDNNSFLNFSKTKISKNLNQRNIVSGTVRTLYENYSSLYCKKLLSFYPYDVINNKELKSQSDIYNFLKKINFYDNKLIFLSNNINLLDDLLNYADNLEENKIYPMDGVVLKVNSFYKRKNIGYTSKFPKWSIAYKFHESQEWTKIKSYRISIGRTGRINYIGQIDPVLIDNTIIKNVTLNGYHFIKTKNIFVNSNVLVIKSGKIIPKIIEVDNLNIKNLIKINNIEECISCNSKIRTVQKQMYCINNECPERIINNLIYFCSINCFNIIGLGKQIIISLYNNKIIRNIYDIITLSNKKEIILKTNLNKKIFSELILDKILQRIKETNFWNIKKLFTSIGIPLIGKVTIMLILNKYRTYNELINANKEGLEKIKGIGKLTANSIYNYLHTDKTKELLTKLLNSKEINTEDNNYKKMILKNLVFVITGKLSNPRKYFVDLIEGMGGIVKNNISNDTNYLINNNVDGKKYNEAIKRKIKIINEAEFLKLIK